MSSSTQQLSTPLQRTAMFEVLIVHMAREVPKFLHLATQQLAQLYLYRSFEVQD